MEEVTLQCSGFSAQENQDTCQDMKKQRDKFRTQTTPSMQQSFHVCKATSLDSCPSSAQQGLAAQTNHRYWT
jgi:hypothetical protein